MPFGEIRKQLFYRPVCLYTPHICARTLLYEPRAAYDDACAKIDALAEALDEEAAGTALFEIVAACRQSGIDPESALRRKTLAVQQACLKNANAEN